MEFGFTEAHEKLRKEVHEWCLNELPEDYTPGGELFSKEAQDFWGGMVKKAVDTGYYVPGWDKEYGGQGRGTVEQNIIDQELGRMGVRWPDSIGLHIFAPALTMFGTEEHKRRFLPPMARGEGCKFQAFTEPDAGSDEASITTRAVLDGDEWVLNGQKTFITGNQQADWLYVNAVTEVTTPKHRGVSLFMVPADAPGVTLRPLPTMSASIGAQHEIFFDDVRIPKGDMLGQLNRGFYHVMQVFEFERIMTGGVAAHVRLLDEFVQFCKETKRDGKPLIEDPRVRDTLAQLAIWNEIQRLASWKVVWQFAERERLGPARYNVSMYYGKKWSRLRAKAMADIIGLYGQLKSSSKWAALAGRIEGVWKSSRSIHAGGTFEIYKYVLAGRSLGLPRFPAKLVAEAGKMLKEREAARR